MEDEGLVVVRSNFPVGRNKRLAGSKLGARHQVTKRDGIGAVRGMEANLISSSHDPGQEAWMEVVVYHDGRE